jgi:hypothetical protein
MVDVQGYFSHIKAALAARVNITHAKMNPPTNPLQ